MASQQSSRRLPKFRFRVLIIGRANAGKTTILQRVCETTKSPKVYRIEGSNRTEIELHPTQQCGQHNIEDELIFENNEGYIFHDSRGIESGNEDELNIIQDFVREKTKEKTLAGRLHAIWYCIPTDNQRPSLDIKFIHDICPDKNVPIIAIFTKYDQFPMKIEMELEDDGCEDLSPEEIEKEVEKCFQERYSDEIRGLPYVKLEGMNERKKDCQILIDKTVEVLNDDVVAIMLIAVQKGNVEIAARASLKRWG